MSSESTSSRRDCGFGGITANGVAVAGTEANPDRVRGIRIFDIKDPKNPKLVKSVETCRGSHTHTVVTQPGDKDNVYVYVQGTSGVRPEAEVKGCVDTGADAADDEDMRQLHRGAVLEPTFAQPRLGFSQPMPIFPRARRCASHLRRAHLWPINSHVQE
jgi:hypothetical protein